jgi:cytochrome b involved in lipid metabolism
MISFLFLLSYPSKTYSQSSYTLEDVSKHNKPADCWMSINQKVYDLGNYLEDHDDKLNIRPWCGKEATKDFQDKAGRNKDHSSKAYTMLEEYYIGDLDLKPSEQPSINQLNNTKTVTQDQEKISINSSNPYDFYIPFLFTLFAYLISMKILGKNTHNFIWNSVMLIGLIPSFIYGIIMILSFQYPFFKSLRYNQMLYHHVELSVIFGTACILHFANRIRTYICQAKNIPK